jgi:hypothetical protein
VRFFKLNTALLALIFSIVAAALLFFIIRIFGKFSGFGDPLNFIGWFGFWFAQLPFYFLPRRSFSEILWAPAFLIQLWLIFFLGIICIRKFYKTSNSETLKIIIIVLTIAFIVSLGLLLHSQGWQNSNWKDEVIGLARVHGAEEAKQDFEAGKIRIFVISNECDYPGKFSGTKDGPFEIWTSEFYPQLPWPYHFSLEQKVEAYNREMRYKYNWSLTHTNNEKSVY